MLLNSRPISVPISASQWFQGTALALLVVAALLGAAPAPEANTISLAGVIDLHCHSAPDTVARSINSFGVVRQAKAAGMRGVVLKNHFVSTAALAELAME